MAELRERLATYAHNTWAGWMAYLFEKSTRNDDGSVTIPPELVGRWVRQMSTQYECLPENERESNRAEADQMLELTSAPLMLEALRELLVWETRTSDCPCERCKAVDAAEAALAAAEGESSE